MIIYLNVLFIIDIAQWWLYHFYCRLCKQCISEEQQSTIHGARHFRKVTENHLQLHQRASAGATNNCKETGCDPFQKLFDPEPLYLCKFENGSIAVFLLSLAASAHSLTIRFLSNFYHFSLFVYWCLGLLQSKNWCMFNKALTDSNKKVRAFPRCVTCRL